MPRLMEQLGIDKLSVEDRMVLIEELQESFDVGQPPVPEWHLRVIEQRLEELKADPVQGEAYEAVMDRLLAKYGGKP